MNIKSEQIKVLKNYIPNIEEIITEDDIGLVLDAIDDVIVSNILSHNNEPDEEGIKLQKIYDQIFAQN